MKIQCENCSVEHELDPPAWVVSSGRPFRFRCSSCGHSQMVSAQAPKVSAEEAVTQPRKAADEPSAPPFDAQAVQAPPSESSGAPPVYLKQEGKVYLVRDWATVQRWIMERRVDREDLVSEGGVRWEPIGNRAELGSFFAAVEQLEANEQQVQAPPEPAPMPTPFSAPAPAAAPPPNPFANPFPFGGAEDDSASTGRFGRLDDDTEGVSMGLPPLPTEEAPGAAEAGPDTYPEQPAVRRGAARMSEPSAAPGDEIEFGEVEPASSARDLARLRADTIPPDVAPPALPPTPAPLPRVEVSPVRTPSALALADTVIHEPEDEPKPAPDEEDDEDDPFAGFGKPVTAHDTAPVNDWDPEPPPRSWPGWLLPVMGLLVTGILVIGGGTIAYVVANRPPKLPAPTAHVVDADPDLGKVIKVPEPEKAPAADTDPPAAVEDTDAAAPAAVPAPEVAPVETTPKVAVDPSKPPVEKAASPAKLVEKGWAAVDSGDLARAGSQFQKALGSAPDNADANFGYGYVLLKQGQNDLAQRHLCRALKLTGDASDVGREASGLITASGMSCP